LILVSLLVAGIVWAWPRPVTSTLAEGVAAYGRGEWAKAGELARRQLKAVPGDTESLRLLARSTARMGRDAKLSDLAIVSPAQGSREGSLRRCAQYHALHQNLGLPRTDPFWIRFQGTTLAWSKFYTESARAFDCVTCHDPDRNAEHSASHYEAKCLVCHSSPAIGEASGQPSGSDPAKEAGGSACPINPSRDCLGCHMPPFRSQPLHAIFWDHYIRVHPELRKPQGDSVER
jgi:hypothetical protein